MLLWWLLVAPASCSHTLARFVGGGPRVPKRPPTPDAGTCAPRASDLWLIGSFHKTGTVLNQKILSSISRRHAAAKLATLGGPGRAQVIDAATSGAKIVFVQNFAVDSPRAWRDDVKAYASRLTLRVRAVAWIRDPMELVTSAYFYHLKAREHLAVGPGSSSPVWSACAERGPSSALCETVGAASWGGTRSYQDLLHALPPEEGVLVEALRSLPTVEGMNRTAFALRRSRRAPARLQDLDRAVASFNATFESLFRFLGVPAGAALGACLGAAARHDLASHPSNHAFDTKHRDLRARLRAHLRGDPWWAATYGPLRRALGYDAS